MAFHNLIGFLSYVRSTWEKVLYVIFSLFLERLAIVIKRMYVSFFLLMRDF